MQPLTRVAGVAFVLSVLISIPETVQGRTGQELLEEWRAGGLRKTWLWTECRKIPTWVVYGPAEHSRIPYPTKESIDTIIHSRLRAAHLYAKIWESTGVLLSIDILPILSMQSITDEPNVILNEWVWISFEFSKKTDDPWTEEPIYAQVWSRQRVVGVSRLRENVSEMMDDFLEAYLLFNESACRKK